MVMKGPALSAAAALVFARVLSVLSLDMEILPPGCQCTMERCCNDTRCSWLDNIDLNSICEPFLNGTADPGMQVCDAVLGYVKTNGEVSRNPGPTNKHSTFHIFIDRKSTCDDLFLEEDNCQAPYTQDGGINHSVFNTKLYDGGKCTLKRLDPQNGTVIVASFGCSGPDSELAIYPGVLPEENSFLGVCPLVPKLYFSKINGKGPNNKKWMCIDVPAGEGSTALMGQAQENARIDSARFVFATLGDLPCGFPPIGGEWYSSSAPIVSLNSSSNSSSSSSSRCNSAVKSLRLSWIISLLLCFAALVRAP